MKYEKQINAFKIEINRLYKVNDCSKPKKNTKELLIVIQEHENSTAFVHLNYMEEFYRMFGKHNTVWTEIFHGDLKTACEVARELKKEINLPIKFWKYEELEML